MKAARLHKIGSSLNIEEIAEPTLRPSGVIVRILKTFIPSFTAQVLSGELNYQVPPLPFTPGTSAIGIIETVADDVSSLERGQMVFCDQYIASHNISTPPDAILMGWTGLAPASSHTQSLWKDGAMAQKALFPAECLTPITNTSISTELLAAIGYLAIPYGGFLRGNLRPSQVVIINGATGNLGTAAILVALAMGASKVVAVGRNTTALSELEKLDERRVVSVSLSGNTEEDAQKIKKAAGEADLVLDVLGRVTNPNLTLNCIRALRPKGTAVFMGGVKADIPLPYAEIMIKEITISGAFMFPRQAPKDLLELASAGILNLQAIQTHVYDLVDANKAVEAASNMKGLDYCILSPNAE